MTQCLLDQGQINIAGYQVRTHGISGKGRGFSPAANEGA